MNLETVVCPCGCGRSFERNATGQMIKRKKVHSLECAKKMRQKWCQGKSVIQYFSTKGDH